MEAKAYERRAWHSWGEGTRQVICPQWLICGFITVMTLCLAFPHYCYPDPTYQEKYRKSAVGTAAALCGVLPSDLGLKQHCYFPPCSKSSILTILYQRGPFTKTEISVIELGIFLLMRLFSISFQTFSECLLCVIHCDSVGNTVMNETRPLSWVSREATPHLSADIVGRTPSTSNPDY